MMTALGVLVFIVVLLIVSSYFTLRGGCRPLGERHSSSTPRHQLLAL
jgi:hypothetical protein